MYRRLRLPGIAWALLVLGPVALGDGAGSDPAAADESLDEALQSFADRTGLQLVYPTGLAEGKTAEGAVAARAVKNPEQALELLLAGSGLGFRFVNARTVAIEQTGEQSGGSAADAESDGTDAKESEAKADEDEEADDDVEVVVVTGSRIPRQPGEMDRHVVTYDRFDIEASGATTFEEFLRDVPQSVNAPSSNGAAFAGSFGSVSNYFAAAGVNLRGLGERVTLVLIDGRRTARGGILGEATDINQIPMSKIERVEVIFDGASAIYGADAVGGVVNIITRKDYEGVDVRLYHSEPQDGGTVTRSVAFGGTHAWGLAKSGSVTVSYERLTRTKLNGDERNLRFRTSDFVSPYSWPPNISSGTGWVEIGDEVLWLRLPLYMLDADGNPVPYGDPEGVTPVHRTNLPEGSDGDVSLEDFYGLEYREGSRPEAGLSLMPARHDDSVRVRLRQELTERLELSGAISITRGDSYALQSNHNQNFKLDQYRINWRGPLGSPYSPFPGASWFYAEFDFLPDVERFTEKEMLNGHFALAGRFGDNWEWELAASRSSSENNGLQLNRLNTSWVGCLESPFERWCGPDQAEARVQMLNPFILPYFGLESEEEFVDLFIIPARATASESTDTQYDVMLRGALFKAPGGDAQALLNVSRRAEATYLFDDAGGLNADPWLGLIPVSGYYNNEMTRDTDSVSFELNVPLFGPDNALSFVRGLDVTFSGRYDDVTSGGGRIREREWVPGTGYTTNFDMPVTPEDAITAWSAGFVWQPVDWLRVRANVNESYAAPPLVSYVTTTTRSLETYTFRDENYQPLLDDEGNPLRQPYVRTTGGNPELRPERNLTRSVGFDLMPEAVPNLVARVNLHWNELVDRIGRAFSPARQLTPELFSTEHSIYDVDESTGLPIRRGSSWRSNLGDVNVSGVDAEVTYFADTPLGSLDFRLTYGYVHESVWRLIDDCGPVLLNQFDYPQTANCEYATFDDPTDVVGSVPVWEQLPRIDFFDEAPYDPIPRHRFRLRVGWDLRGLHVGMTTSHQSRTVRGVRRWNGVDDYVRGTQTVTAANPVNLVFRYDFEKAARRPALLRNTRIQLSVPNILNDNAKFELEPRFTYDTHGYFDPIASRPSGRGFTLTINKQFAGN